jgi:hypothetical protein
VLTEEKMHKYFGEAALEKVIGQELIYLDSIRVMVTGIVRNRKVTPICFERFYFTEYYRANSLKQNFYLDTGTLSSNSRTFVKLAQGITP